MIRDTSGGVDWPDPGKPVRNKEPSQPKESEKPVKKPDPKDFEGGAVQKAVFKQTIQHPLTILPAAVSAVSLFWMAIIDHDPKALGVAAFCGFLSVGSWVFNYFIRGDKLAKDRVEKLRADLHRYREAEARSFREEFLNVGCEEGAKELQELEEAYSKLRDFLATKTTQSGTLNLGNLATLADDAYQKGRRFLLAALEVRKALKSIDIKTLESELKDWQRQLKKGLRDSEAKLLTAKVESHQRRIKNFQDKEKLVTDLISKSNDQESALQLAHMNLAELIEQNQDRLVTQTSDASDSLDAAVERAKKVEEQMRNAGNTSPEDEMYLKAAQSQ